MPRHYTLPADLAALTADSPLTDLRRFREKAWSRISTDRAAGNDESVTCLQTHVLRLTNWIQAKEAATAAASASSRMTQADGYVDRAVKALGKAKKQLQKGQGDLANLTESLDQIRIQQVRGQRLDLSSSAPPPLMHVVLVSLLG